MALGIADYLNDHYMMYHRPHQYQHYTYHENDTYHNEEYRRDSYYNDDTEFYDPVGDAYGDETVIEYNENEIEFDIDEVCAARPEALRVPRLLTPSRRFSLLCGRMTARRMRWTRPWRCTAALGRETCRTVAAALGRASIRSRLGVRRK